MSVVTTRNPQLNRSGELTHLLTLEGLPAEIVTHILNTAEPFCDVTFNCVTALSSSMSDSVRPSAR